MGQYYIIYNLTKKQSVKPAFANWKEHEWEWDNVIETMGWEKTDDLRAYGDSGDVIFYNEGLIRKEFSCENEDNEEISQDDNNVLETTSEGTSEKTVTNDVFEKKYICEITGKIVDHEYSQKEYVQLLKEEYSQLLKEEYVEWIKSRSLKETK
jgi:hypothetical protein